MWSGVELPGMTAAPLCLAQASRTELTVMPRFFAMLAIVLPTRSEVENLAPPSELYAVVTIPLSAHVATARCHAGDDQGWYWIWFTSGDSVVASSRSLISPSLKLLTPIARTLPDFFALISAFQTAIAADFPIFGE